MAAGGFREFIAGEVLDEDKINDFLMQGILVFAGTAARGSAIPAPVEGQFTFLKDTDALEFYDGAAFVPLSTGFPAAKTSSTKTGTYTDGDGFVFDFFDYTANGSFVVTEAGFLDVLVVGAGASSRNVAGGGSGGGGGGVRFGLFYVAAGTVTVTVGAGGSGTSGDFSIVGGNSSFGSVLLAGGGAAAWRGTSAAAFVNSPIGGGGGAGGLNNGSASDANGAGAGGLLYGANNQSGISLNYTGTSLEFGRGGTTATPTANRGQGGDHDVDGGAGSDGRVIVKVKA